MIFLFPTQMEAAKFVTLHPQAEVIICGVGCAEAAATVAQIAAAVSGEQLILAGIAGSYDLDKLPVGCVVECVSEQIEELPQRFKCRYEIAPRWGLTQARSNSVNGSNRGGGGCDVENMEGAAVAAICQRLGVALSEIRAISNHVGDPTSEWQIERAIDALTDVLSTIYKAK